MSNPELDQPDGETFSLQRFANEAWDKANLADFQADKKYVQHLYTLPDSYKTFRESEVRRIAAKWYPPQDADCKQQPKRRKPRNYTDYDIDDEGDL